MKLKNILIGLSVTLVLVLVTSCSQLSIPSGGLTKMMSTPAVNQPDTVKPKFPDIISEVKIGKLSDNLKITAIDGSFTFYGGKTFRPSNFSYGWVNPGSGLATKWKQSKGTKVKIDYDYNIEDPENTEKKIRKKGQIYGILEFDYVYNDCSDLPAARNYYIEIPYGYIEGCKGGRITTKYEKYDCAPTIPEQVDKRRATYTTWVLWLSDIPF